MDQVQELKRQYIARIVELQGDLSGEAYAAKLNISISRLSNLRNGHTFGFSMDSVMRMLIRAGGEL